MKNLREEIRKLHENHERTSGIPTWQYYEKLLALFRQVVEEVIGADDEMWHSKRHDSDKADFQNELRNEQRERLNQLIEKKWYP
jgi:predicted Ser/Thr protein kinase